MGLIGRVWSWGKTTGDRRKAERAEQRKGSRDAKAQRLAARLDAKNPDGVVVKRYATTGIFRRDAPKMAAAGWVPTSQSVGDGGWHVVTYQRRAAGN